MAFDRSTIAPEAQAHNIEIGKDYASTDVLLQIDRLLKAWLKYQPLLIKHGYTEQLAQLTIDVRTPAKREWALTRAFFPTRIASRSAAFVAFFSALAPVRVTPAACMASRTSIVSWASCSV